MIITRENFEKAIRRAKAEGRREAAKEFQIQQNMECAQRNYWELENRINKRFDNMEEKFRSLERGQKEDKYQTAYSVDVPDECKREI